MKFKPKSLFNIICTIILTSQLANCQSEGAHLITQNSYQGCIELSNGTTRVVLEPNLGGRVLVYELKGNNVLYIDPQLNGWIYKPGDKIEPSAGRFDIGPEFTVPSHPALWFGKWTGKITGPREAELISQKDTATGVQLVRKFKLADNSSFLEVTQVIKNVGNQVRRYGHWSRTFVEGGGISLTPLNPNSKYPKGYIIYGPGNIMNFLPDNEDNIRVRNGILEIIGTPSRPKFVMDGDAGWLAYLTNDNQLLIKKYTVYPDRVYPEIAASTTSIYYFKEQFCEVEPLGPMETLKPGEEVSFTERWFLLDYPYPANKFADLDDILRIIKEL
jgi:hypothetical protein